jgi:RNAse (barnase) inhibitor barstar
MNEENVILGSENRCETAFHIVIPSTIASKAQLLDVFGEHLKFPDWWGKNWDALDELLNDLSWINEKTVWIEHETFPDIGKSELAIYIQILNDAMTILREEGEKRLVVSFG